MGAPGRVLAALTLAAGLACGAQRPPSDMTARLDLDGWVEVTSAQFSIASSATPARTLELARQLEVFAVVVARTTSMERTRPRLPARFYLFRDRSAFALFWGSGVSGWMSPSPRGFFMLMSPDLAVARETLFHEYVHYVIRNDSALYYPVWYDEGLAEMLSTVRIREPLITLGAVPHGAMETMAARRPLPCRKVFGATRYRDLHRRDLRLFYVQSWALVHYFHAGHRLGHPKRFAQMREYLARLNRGEDWEEAFVASFDATPEAFDAELGAYWDQLVQGRYVAKISLDTRKLGMASGISEADVHPLAPAQAAYELGELYLDRGEPASRYALRLLDQALDEDPEHVGALAGRARARALLGDFDAAEIDLARGTALAPTDAALQRAVGDVHSARAGSLAQEPGDPGRVELEAARAAYRASIESDPRLPAGYVALGRTYLEEEADDPGPGIDALRAAHGALPWMTSLDLDLGRLYARAGRTREARAHLEEVLRWSHGDEEREQATVLLDELELAAEGPGS